MSDHTTKVLRYKRRYTESFSKNYFLKLHFWGMWCRVGTTICTRNSTWFIFKFTPKKFPFNLMQKPSTISHSLATANIIWNYRRILFLLGACRNSFLVFVSDRSRSGLARKWGQIPDSPFVLP